MAAPTDRAAPQGANAQEGLSVTPVAPRRQQRGKTRAKRARLFATPTWRAAIGTAIPSFELLAML